MTDRHTEAIAEYLSGWQNDFPAAHYAEIAGELWEAAVASVVAHEPCNGTGEMEIDNCLGGVGCERGDWAGAHRCPRECPGPHVVFDTPDGKLYGDGVGVAERFPVRELIDALRDRGALPSSWTVEATE